MSETEEGRSEQATPYKLRRARERGVVAHGADLGYLAALGAFAAYVWLLGPQLAGQITQAARGALVVAPDLLASPDTILSATGQVLTSALAPIAFLMLAIFAVVVVAELIQTGVVFSAEPLRPDFSRLSPARGLKRVFSVRLLIETAKNVLKLGVYGALAWIVIQTARAAGAPAIDDAGDLARLLDGLGTRLLTFFVGGAVVFAIIDQLISRRDFLSRMRMSRREVRRELRDREGDARLKQRRRALHREFVSLSQSLKNIRGADVLVVNPVHLAIALRYDAATMTAPKVVARGSHRVAARLKRLAFVYGVVTVENRPLAQALYRSCAIDREVPQALYRPVADIYLTLKDRVSQRTRSTGRV